MSLKSTIAHMEDNDKEKTCQHIFVFGEEKEFESCLGTHEVSKCLNCGANHMMLHLKALRAFYEKNNVENIDENEYCKPIGHFCVWDLTSGCCGSKLQFPERPDGTEYGFKTKKFGNCTQKEEIVERTTCPNRLNSCEMENYKLKVNKMKDFTYSDDEDDDF